MDRAINAQGVRTYMNTQPNLYHQSCDIEYNNGIICLIKSRKYKLFNGGEGTGGSISTKDPSRQPIKKSK